MVRMVNSLHEARNRKEHLVVVIMNFESFYERIQRAELQKKAAEAGVKGRKWMYLGNFLQDKCFYIRVNENSSQVMTSRVGIPQSSVISPVQCNLYTYDCMKKVICKHGEYDDDGGTSTWKSDKDLSEVEVAVNGDIGKIENCNGKWNMLVAAVKTEVIRPKNTQDNSFKDCDE